MANIKAMQDQATREADAISQGKGTADVLKAIWDVDGVISDAVENNPEVMDILMNVLLRNALCKIARDKTMKAGAGVKGTGCPLYTRFVNAVYGIQLKDQAEIDEINSRLPKATRVSKKVLYECAPDLAAKYDNPEHRTPVPMNEAYASVVGGMALIKQLSLIADIIAERQEATEHYLE